MSFAAETRHRTPPTLPLASMVDIMFLLLVFFLTTSAMRDQERVIDVSVPEAASGAVGRSKTPIVVTVDPEGRIFVGDRLFDTDSLKEYLQRIAIEFPDESVVIRGDRQSKLETSVAVLDTAYAAGFRNVFIATASQKPND